MGTQAYDAVAGTQGLTISRFTSASESRRQFPTLAESGPGGRTLKGTVRARPGVLLRCVAGVLALALHGSGTCCAALASAGARHQASLCVQIVYYDGQFDDARLNVTLACTAAHAGAAVLNHASVTSLLKVRPRELAPHPDQACAQPLALQDDHGKVHGVRVQDNLSGKTHEVYARQVRPRCLPLLVWPVPVNAR